MKPVLSILPRIAAVLVVAASQASAASPGSLMRRWPLPS